MVCVVLFSLNHIKASFFPCLIMGSRQTRRSNGERTRSSNSQLEESNSTVNEDTESENETDLVSVLAFLLRR